VPVCYNLYRVRISQYNIGGVRTVEQIPMTEDGRTKDWKCKVSYFNGDDKVFILPSPGIKIRLSEEEAREGARSLKPQLYTGGSTDSFVCC
jgi:hypothetical protein